MYRYIKDEMGWACSMHGAVRNTNIILTGNHEGMRPRDDLDTDGR
jgi:hypothetical protein